MRSADRNIWDVDLTALLLLHVLIFFFIPEKVSPPQSPRLLRHRIKGRRDDCKGEKIETALRSGKSLARKIRGAG
ncbi:hypothetical protein F2P81_006421 [Scophthalmus maximus]|uniref:Uncharacterized protein n=1 Tax=Scophthalmus maximus TaxID=52904 RepID=A0A6A4T363_SCOMX|nr:hypothetical protein F2P81_006421 [Scophthalmus maximus]